MIIGKDRRKCGVQPFRIGVADIDDIHCRGCEQFSVMRKQLFVCQRLHLIARTERGRAVALVFKHQCAQSGQRIFRLVVDLGVNVRKLVALFAFKIGLLEPPVFREGVIDDLGKQLCALCQNIVQRIVVAQRIQ